MKLEQDFYDLFYRYFETTVLSIEDAQLSGIARQMAAFFLIEKAFKNIADLETIQNTYLSKDRFSSSIHWFRDVVDDFYSFYERKAEIEKIFNPFKFTSESWENDLIDSLKELADLGYLSIQKKYNWHEYDLELAQKLTTHQKIPYSVVMSK